MNNSYGDFVDISKAERKLHTFKVLCEWPSAREQLKLENMCNPELGIDLGQKLPINQQFYAIKVYDSIGASSGAIFTSRIFSYKNCMRSFRAFDILFSIKSIILASFIIQPI
jgi:hypothetical protein